ncbi:MAG: hypothetical protein IJH67_09120 [Thermoguttaceae bacterium]|nr:hypothetical protein [Thermoguttaceae bacterium]
MKLTLRTLLAYIDNLLPQQDAEEFEALLSKNEAANNLCNRIRSVMTRPELGAPDVLDKGLHLDPNVTAEYLDNVLSSEESPEYERLCISSDRQLGEVSACHQILTVVQIEPAEVDPTWRDKIYTAPERVSNEESVDLGGGFDEPAPSSSGFMASLSGILSGASGILGGGQSLKLNLDRKAQPAPVEKSEPIPEPPEPVTPPAFQNTAPPEPEPQMESSADDQPNVANPQAALEQYAQMIAPEIETQEAPRQNSLTWILSLAAMAALVILFVVLFLSPRNKGASEMANNDNSAVTEKTSPSDSAAVPEGKPADDSSKETAPAKTTQPAEGSADANPTAPEGAPAGVSADDELPPVEPIDPQPQPETPTDVSEDNPGLETDPAPETAADDDASIDSLPGLEDTAAENGADITPITEDDGSAAAEPDNNVPEEGAQPADSAPAEEETAEDNSLELFENDAPQKMAQLGQFVKRKGVEPQILAFKAHGENTMWRRMSENSSIRSGDALLAFPDYRPDVNLGADVRLRLVGPARVSISPKSTPDDIHLTLEYGRLILVTSKAFSKKITIKCAALPATLEINQPSVKAAFEAGVLKPESDPALTPANFYGTISLLLGSANLAYKGSLSSIEASTIIDCQSGAVNDQGTPADWIQNETLPATDLEKRLTADKPVGVTLSEIIDSKTISKELRQTVLISLSMVGQYATLVEDFNKEDRFAVWMDEFIVLQDSIFKSQANAQNALEELKKRYDDNGERIYEILWKYHSDLSDKDMSELIRDLRDETLCVRVAAFCLLKSRGVNLGAYKPTDLKKSETSLKSLENKYKVSPTF